MATVTYEVTMDERDAVTFIDILENAAEEGMLASAFEIQRIPTCDDEEG